MKETKPQANEPPTLKWPASIKGASLQLSVPYLQNSIAQQRPGTHGTQCTEN